MPAAALMPILVLVVAIIAYSWRDLARSEVRYVPKWVWAVLCLSVPLGPIAYFTIGRVPR